MTELINLGNVYGDFNSGYAGNVWDSNGLCPTIKNAGSGGDNNP